MTDPDGRLLTAPWDDICKICNGYRSDHTDPHAHPFELDEDKTERRKQVLASYLEQQRLSGLAALKREREYDQRMAQMFEANQRRINQQRAAERQAAFRAKLAQEEIDRRQAAREVLRQAQLVTRRRQLKNPDYVNWCSDKRMPWPEGQPTYSAIFDDALDDANRFMNGRRVPPVPGRIGHPRLPYGWHLFDLIGTNGVLDVDRYGKHPWGTYRKGLELA